jgi:hypothetical protein
MWNNTAVLLAILLVPVITYGGEIYKWTDENGQVHYGNSISKSQKSTAKEMEANNVSISNSQYSEYINHPAHKDKLIEATSPEADGAKADQVSSASNSEAIGEKANDKVSCAAKLDQFHRSQECFAPYQNVNGSFKPGAFEHCQAVKYPIECPL